MHPRAPPALALALLAAFPAALALPAEAPGGPAGPAAQPLGELDLRAGVDPSCPEGHACMAFTVRCAQLQEDWDGVLGLAPPLGPLRGVVALFRGSGGTLWWTHQQAPAADFVRDLQQDGFLVAQVRWEEEYNVAALGEEAGLAGLMCRPATVLAWLHDTLWAPAEPLAGRGPGVCGFCVAGNSNGAAQSLYPLGYYGLEDRLDAAVASGGPPHAAMAKACLRNPAERAYWYDEPAADRFFGFGKFPQGGPCDRADPAWAPRWEADGLATGAADYVHPATRVHFLWGSLDRGIGPVHGSDYAARLRAEGSPWVATEEMPGVPHQILASPAGLARMRAALLAAPEGSA